jgi:hypothetical protein
MLITRSELFTTNPDSKGKWLSTLVNKILQTEQESEETQINTPEKSKKIKRLKNKSQRLIKARENLAIKPN